MRIALEGVRMSRNSRIGGTGVLVAALLWAGSGAAAAQEPPKLDAFAGGGLGISEGGAGFGVHVGGGVWATEHLRVGGLLYPGGAIGLLSTHLRLPMDDNSDLLVGITPLWIWPGSQGGSSHQPWRPSYRRGSRRSFGWSSARPSTSPSAGVTSRCWAGWHTPSIDPRSSTPGEPLTVVRLSRGRRPVLA